MKTRLAASLLLVLLASLFPARGTQADIVGPSWNWSNSFNWGYGYSATFAQTFRGDGQALTGARFRMYDESCCYYWPFRWMVMEWDTANNRAKGPVLAQADAQWSNWSCCWFDRTTQFPQRPVLSPAKTYVLILTVSPWWGNYCCSWSRFAINPDYEYPDGSFWYLSNGGDMSAFAAQSWTNAGYDLNFTVYTTPDCDGNGVPDAQELDSSSDCDGNGVLDRCESQPAGSTSRSAGPQGPVGAGAGAIFDFAGLVPPATGVDIVVTAAGDLSATHEFLSVRIGAGIERLVFTGAEQDCATLTATVSLTRQEFTDALDGNDLRITVTGGPTVDAGACGGGSWAAVSFNYQDAWPDCNGNLSSDAEDLCAGTSADCNGNRTPDECDIASSASQDLDGNGQPDECQPDCNGDLRPDGWQIATGEVPDCDLNSVPDSCDLSSGVAVDCDSNAIPDSCDIASGASPDCDFDGKIDSCAIAQGLVADCDLNGVPDACDIVAGTGTDCDLNGSLDSCDVASSSVSAEPATQSPFNSGSPLRFEAGAMRRAASDVRVELVYAAYTSQYYGWWMRLDLDGVAIDQWIDSYWGDCSARTRRITIAASTWNAALSDGVAPVTAQFSGYDWCAGWCQIKITYQAQPLSPDCNSNSLPDGCDLLSGVAHDCDANGLPDSCDIANGAEDESANGYPDRCDLDRGDLNLDGQVSGADLGILLTLWGSANYPIGDLNHDGLIGGADLGILLTNWGEAF